MLRNRETWPLVLPVTAVFILVVVLIIESIALSGLSWFVVRTPSRSPTYQVQFGLSSVERVLCTPHGECLRDVSKLAQTRRLSPDLGAVDEAGTRARGFGFGSIVAVSILTLVSVARIVSGTTSARVRILQALSFLLAFALTMAVLFAYAGHSHGFGAVALSPFFNPGGIYLNVSTPVVADATSAAMRQSYGTHFSLMVACVALLFVCGVFLFVPIVSPLVSNSLSVVIGHRADPDVALVSPHVSFRCPRCAVVMMGEGNSTALCVACAAPVRVPPPGRPLRMYLVPHGGRRLPMRSRSRANSDATRASELTRFCSGDGSRYCSEGSRFEDSGESGEPFRSASQHTLDW